MIQIMAWYLLSLSFGLRAASASEQAQADHVIVSWVAPEQFSGEQQAIGIRFQIDPHWHIYWKNPGDSGTAPKFRLQSAQADLGAVEWPAPKRFVVGDFTNIGYETEVVFPFTVKPHQNAAALQIQADLEWLVCQEECLPGFAQLSLNRPVADRVIFGQGQALLDRFKAQVPRDQASSPWQLRSVERIGDELKVSLKGFEDLSFAALDIFPVDSDILEPAAPRRLTDDKAFLFKMKTARQASENAAFVLVDGKGMWEFSAVSLAASIPKLEWMSYLILLLSALMGGVILNLMPCVLPVLSIKFFSLAKVNGPTRWRETLLYTLGVLVTFTALGGLFLALRAGGTAIGWGFQLQSPMIVTALILLFWLMGLSFLGFFEFGNTLTQAAGKFENSGSFATGCLSVFIATPCTGPFMGTALGAAATLPALQSLFIFFFLGLGLASPFLALAVFPKIKLPRPGLWMVTLRQLLAFPLFATVIWLLWVLGHQLGSDAWLYLTTLGLIISFSLWLGKGRGLIWQAVAWSLALGATAFTARWVATAPLVSELEAAQGKSTWMEFEPQLVQKFQAQGLAVFVDFTAAWCVTCQVNKKLVLETDAAAKIFADHNVQLIRADWTNLDPDITAALAFFERASVPLYVYYPADGSRPLILPQILSLSDIEGLFQK